MKNMTVLKNRYNSKKNILESQNIILKRLWMINVKKLKLKKNM